MYDLWCLYSTFPDKESAILIADNLLKENLIACANITEGVTSLYKWQGERQQAEECVLIAKTQQACVDQAIERIRQLHSYDVPCVAAWPLEKGYHEFFQWVRSMTPPVGLK